jgi:hypothetical protein
VVAGIHLEAGHDLDEAGDRPEDLDPLDARGPAEPISWRSVEAPKLPPLPTVRWIDRSPSPSSTTTLTRAPMAARFVFTPSSFSLSQLFPCPGFAEELVVGVVASTAPPTTE